MHISKHTYTRTNTNRYANPPVDNNGDGCVDQSLFTSIPSTFWFVVATMTTVGYGDFVPLTTIGKLLSMLTALGGILILALPITVITHNFEVECTKQEEEKKERQRRALARAQERLRRRMAMEQAMRDPNAPKPRLWSTLRNAITASPGTSFRRTVTALQTQAGVGRVKSEDDSSSSPGSKLRHSMSTLSLHHHQPDTSAPGPKARSSLSHSASTPSFGLLYQAATNASVQSKAAASSLGSGAGSESESASISVPSTPSNEDNSSPVDSDSNMINASHQNNGSKKSHVDDGKQDGKPSGNKDSEKIKDSKSDVSKDSKQTENKSSKKDVNSKATSEKGTDKKKNENKKPVDEGK
jgi:hypothetical protein